MLGGQLGLKLFASFCLLLAKSMISVTMEIHGKKEKRKKVSQDLLMCNETWFTTPASSLTPDNRENF